MYRRSSRQRRENEKPKDYKALVNDMLFENPDKYFTTELTRTVARRYRNRIVKMDYMLQPKHYKKIYDALVAGDPKQRTLRSIVMSAASDYADYSKKFRVTEGGEDNA